MRERCFKGVNIRHGSTRRKHDRLYCPPTDGTTSSGISVWTTRSISPNITTRSARWCASSPRNGSRPWPASWTAPRSSPGRTSRPWASSDSSACPGARSWAAPGWTSSPTTSPSTRWPRWTRATPSPSAPTPTSAPPPSSSSAPKSRSGATCRCWRRARCSADSASPRPARGATPAAPPRPRWTRAITTCSTAPRCSSPTRGSGRSSPSPRGPSRARAARASPASS